MVILTAFDIGVTSRIGISVEMVAAIAIEWYMIARKDTEGRFDPGSLLSQNDGESDHRLAREYTADRYAGTGLRGTALVSSMCAVD